MQVLPTVLISALGAVLISPAFHSQQASGPLVPDLPPTLTAANWTPDFLPYRITVAGASSSYMGMDLQTLMMMSMGGGAQIAPRFMADASSRWTRGDKETINGQTYLVTYKPELPSFLLTMSKPSLSGGSVLLELDLIRTDSVIEIQPTVGLTKDVFLTDAKEAGVTFADNPTPAMMAAASTSSDKARTLSNIKQVDLATIMYENDYDDLMPLAQSTAQVQNEIRPYLKSEESWKTLNPNGGRFLFNTNLSSVNESAIAEPARTPLFFEQNAWPDGKRAVAYVDGHAKMEDEATWQSLQPLLHTKFPKGQPRAPTKGKGRGK